MTTGRRHALRATLILAGVFVAGAIAGVAVHRLWSTGTAHATRPAPSHGCQGLSPDELVDLFVTRLELDAAQRASLEPVLRRGWADIALVYERAEPEIDAVRRRARAAIRATLRPAQAPLHDQVTAELDERRSARRRCRQDGIESARRLREVAP